MKKLIVFEEDEFKSKFLEFCENFIKQQNNSYGIKLQRNTNRSTIKDKNEIIGSLFLIWDNTFNDKGK